MGASAKMGYYEPKSLGNTHQSLLLKIPHAFKSIKGSGKSCRHGICFASTQQISLTLQVFLCGKLSNISVSSRLAELSGPRPAGPRPLHHLHWPHSHLVASAPAGPSASISVNSRRQTHVAIYIHTDLNEAKQAIHFLGHTSCLSSAQEAPVATDHRPPARTAQTRSISITAQSSTAQRRGPHGSASQVFARLTGFLPASRSQLKGSFLEERATRPATLDHPLRPVPGPLHASFLLWVLHIIRVPTVCLLLLNTSS